MKKHLTEWLMKIEIKSMSDDERDCELVKMHIEACIEQIKSTAIIIQQIEDKQYRDRNESKGENIYQRISLKY